MGVILLSGREVFLCSILHSVASITHEGYNIATSKEWGGPSSVL